MADTPPTPPNPKAAAKGLVGKLKGKPAWMYVAGITIIIGLAFFIRRREAVANTADGETPNVVDNTTGSVGDGSLYPSASQGAFGGYSDPTVNSTGTDTATDNAGQPEQSPVFNIILPGPTGDPGQSFAPAEAAASSAITGGGTKAPRVVAQHEQPKNPVSAALARITAIRATVPAPAASPKALQAQAAAAAKPNIFTQDEGPRAALNYKLVHKNNKWYRFYESRPGKGDWGEGGKVLRK